MAEYLIITKDRRIPDDIKSFTYDVLSKEQFVAGANSDEGIEIEGGVFYNIDSLDQNIYEAIKNAMNIPITYYQFSDQNIQLPFVIEEGIKTYNVAPKVVPPTPVVQPPQQPTQPIQPQPVQPVQPPQQTRPVAPTNPVPPQQPRKQDPTPTQIAGIDVVNNPTTGYDPNKLNDVDIINLINEDWNLTRDDENGKV